MTVCPDDGYSFTVEIDATMAPANLHAALATPPITTPIKKPAIRGATIGQAPVRPPVTGPAAVKPRTAPSVASPSIAAGSAAPSAHAASPSIAASAVAVAPPVQTTVAETEVERASDDVPSGAVIGEYRIEKKIGEGGMGAVYSAVHPMIGKKAAIKVISSALGTDPSAIQRFVDEARAVNQIGHPNIVDVFAFGALPDGRNYFVMEHLQGESLGDRMGSATMSLGEAIEILDQIADALEAAHEKKIVHRDLKPDNVFLAAVRGGRTMVKLLDFGIAKLVPADGGMAKTRTGMMMGTPGYISPEQARGKNVDHRTDIYALGCMTFEIACGRLPFIADSAMDMVLMHITEAPPRPSSLWPEIPAPLEQLILGMLDKNPDHRPTLAEIRTTLAELVTSGLVTIDNSRGSAFRSGLGRTPMTGVPITRTGVGMSAPLGTSPGTMSGSGANALGTTPPIAGQLESPSTPSKKPMGLILGVAAAVAVLAGGGIFMATRGGDAPAPAATAKPAVPQPVAMPEPPKPVVIEKTVVPPPVLAADAAVVAATGGVITLTVPEKAKVELDGHEVPSTATGAEIKIDTDGPHVLLVTTSSKRWEKKFDVKGGEKQSFEAKLERIKRGTVPANSNGSNAKKPPTGPGSGSVTKPDDGTCDPFAPGSKC